LFTKWTPACFPSDKHYSSEGIGFQPALPHLLLDASYSYACLDVPMICLWVDYDHEPCKNDCADQDDCLERERAKLCGSKKRVLGHGSSVGRDILRRKVYLTPVEQWICPVFAPVGCNQ